MNGEKLSPGNGKTVLFGFHHAGGSPAAFWGWQRALGPHIEVVPVTLPGRGAAQGGRRHADLDSLVEALAQHLEPRLAERHLFYGHSMGALIAYRLVRLRAERAQRLPERLMVGAFTAPHLAQPIGRAGQLGDDELARWLIGISDIRADLLGGTGRLDEMLARLREDLRLLSTHDGHRTGVVPVPCPIDVFVGEDDPLVRRLDAAQWDAHSTAGSTFHVISGGHFFPRESRAEFFRAMLSVVQPVYN